jgi:hypothetical protein
MDAAAVIREIVTCAEQMQCEICILSLDFRTAFGNALHYYLCHIIIEHGFDDTSIKILCSPYKNVTSISGVNGFLSEKFPIERTLTEDLFAFENNRYTPIIICTPLLLKGVAAPLH